MELPRQYRELYNHWEFHTIKPVSANKEISLNQHVLDEIFQFIAERLRIWEKKQNNEVRPYTKDKILNDYRFCNIYREFDRQTLYFHKRQLDMKSNFQLWLLNMLFSRSIALTETIDKLGFLDFNHKNNIKLAEKLRSLPSPKYGTAYIFPISTIQRSEWNTRENFFCLYYPTVIPKIAKTISRFNRFSVTEALDRILPEFGFKLKFLWTEVLIDIAYQFPQYIDLYKEFPIGPGSKPIMALLNKNEPPEQVNLNLVGKFDRQLLLPTINGQPIYLSAENWEGIGCEFRKYSNLKAGKGRKRRY